MRKNNRRLSVSFRIGWVLVTLCIFGLLSNCRRGKVGGEEQQPPAYKIWPSQPPASCPFRKSTEITGIGFTGRHVHYDLGDTWFPSWAADGKMYSPWTDGAVNGVKSMSALIWGQKVATTGYATIMGDDPLHLRFTDVRRLPRITRVPTSAATPAPTLSTTVSGTTAPTASRIQTVIPRKGSTMTFWDRLWASATPRITARPGPILRTRRQHPIFGEPAKVGRQSEDGVAARCGLWKKHAVFPGRQGVPGGPRRD